MSLAAVSLLVHKFNEKKPKAALQFVILRSACVRVHVAGVQMTLNSANFLSAKK